MKKTIAAVIVSVVLTFIVTENYMIHNMEVSRKDNFYTVSIFGNDFIYE